MEQVMESYYQLLGIAERAGREEIETAYQRQRERYSPARVAELDEELRAHAEQRTIDLDRAYAILIDAEQRRTYDAGLPGRRHPARTGVTRRELAMSAAGLLVGLVLIGTVWFFVGRSAEPALPPIGEMTRPAPEFELPTLEGGNIRLSDYRGKVVLLNFWGTWCEPCKEETPALQAAYQELRGRGLQVIGVNLYSQETGGDQAVREFLSPYGVSYPIALDTTGNTARAFQISPIPVSYFVDPSGNIRFVKVGTLNAAEVRALFERLEPRASAQP
jgi:cytochrome c biogenesis protein CcmG/thiol:disulfide interchange protein DsbE